MHHTCHCCISVVDIASGFLIAHVLVVLIGGMIMARIVISDKILFGGNFRKTDEQGRSQPILSDGVSIGVEHVS